MCLARKNGQSSSKKGALFLLHTAPPHSPFVQCARTMPHGTIQYTAFQDVLTTEWFRCLGIHITCNEDTYRLECHPSHALLQKPTGRFVLERTFSARLQHSTPFSAGTPCLQMGGHVTPTVLVFPRSQTRVGLVSTT